MFFGGFTFFLALIEGILILIAGKWFRIGMQSRFHKDWVAIMGPDKKINIYKANFKKSFYQNPEENVAYLYNHKRDFDLLNIRVAAFDRFSISQKDFGDEYEEPVKLSTDKPRWWRRVLPFLRKKDEGQIEEPYYFVPQKEPKPVEESKEKLTPAGIDNLFNHQKMVAEAEASRKKDAKTIGIFIMLIIVLILAFITVVFSFQASGNSNAAAEIGTKALEGIQQLLQTKVV